VIALDLVGQVADLLFAVLHVPARFIDEYAVSGAIMAS
jgi:hypothetical protein